MKITMKEYTFITNKNASPFITYNLNKESWGYTIKKRIKLIPYLIMFIPAHLIQLISCLWDGGIKYFEMEPRTIPITDDIFEPTTNKRLSHWADAEIVWKSHS